MPAVRTCKRCLGPLSPRSLYGFCSRHPECRRIARRWALRIWRRTGKPAPRLCEHCGQPMRRHCRYPICRRRSCRTAREMWRYHHDPAFRAGLLARQRSYYRRNRQRRIQASNAYKFKARAAARAAGTTLYQLMRAKSKEVG